MANSAGSTPRSRARSTRRSPAGRRPAAEPEELPLVACPELCLDRCEATWRIDHLCKLTGESETGFHRLSLPIRETRPPCMSSCILADDAWAQAPARCRIPGNPWRCRMPFCTRIESSCTIAQVKPRSASGITKFTPDGSDAFSEAPERTEPPDPGDFPWRPGRARKPPQEP